MCNTTENPIHHTQLSILRREGVGSISNPDDKISQNQFSMSGDASLNSRHITKLIESETCVHVVTIMIYIWCIIYLKHLLQFVGAAYLCSD